MLMQLIECSTSLGFNSHSIHQFIHTSSRQHGWSLLGAHRRWEELAVVHPNLTGHEFVEQGVHPQDERLVPLRVQCQVVPLLGIDFQIKELQVVPGQDLLQGPRRVKLTRRVVARELVSSIEGHGDEALLGEVRVVPGEFSRRHRERPILSESFLKEAREKARVHGGKPHVVEKDAWTHRFESGARWIGQDGGEVPTREPLRNVGHGILRGASQSQKRGQQIDVTC